MSTVSVSRAKAHFSRIFCDYFGNNRILQRFSFEIAHLNLDAQLFQQHCHLSRSRDTVAHFDTWVLLRGGSACFAECLNSRSPAPQGRFSTAVDDRGGARDDSV